MQWGMSPTSDRVLVHPVNPRDWIVVVGGENLGRKNLVGWPGVRDAGMKR